MKMASTFRPRAEELESRITPDATAPPGFQITTVTTGLSSPTALTFAPDGRALITEQAGKLRIVENGTLLPTPALSLTVNSTGERGLLGVAIDPNFASNSFIYLYYTTNSGGLHNRVSRFTATGNTINPASEQILLELDPLSASNHNGGALHFGADSKLYIAVGENAVPSNSQTLNNLHGKMLRINSDGSIPADNPFFGTATGKNRAIWALGLRNPFTFAFEPGTGRMFINDVGQNAFEEINDGIAGANYGWPGTEGETTNPSFRSPLLAYGHGMGEGEGFAITGGTFYNPTTKTFPGDFVGDYFYADIATGFIRRYDPASDSTQSFITDVTSPIGLEVRNDGDLYYLSFQAGGQGGLFKVSAIVQSVAPQITEQPTNKLVSIGQSTTFSVTATGTEPFTYQWQRNGQNISGATGRTFTLNNAQLSDSQATFRVIVTNAVGNATSNAATLTVTSEKPPTGTITSPTPNMLFVAGETYTFRGMATDPETGTLGASAFAWKVTYITGDVERPFLDTQVGITEGAFQIPTRTPFDRVDVKYRVTLTVTDPLGLSSTSFVDLIPRLANITLNSDIPGTLSLGGQPFQGTVQGVAGLERDVAALSSIVFNGRRFEFVGWSDGGARAHTIRTAIEGVTLTAKYRLADLFISGAGEGGRPVIRIEELDTGNVKTLEVFPGDFTGGVRVGTGDVTGDGIPDIIVAAGPGGTPMVRILSGVDQSEVRSFMAFEESFRGGVYVAIADVNGDGIDDVILSADEGGGPRIRVLNGGDPSKVLADFFGIEDVNFRGGARISLGDVNRDGVMDLMVGAGFGGGPRIAVFDGRSLLTSTPVKLFGDFFVFEQTLRNGVFTALGDIDGDGFADVIAGGGPGGSGRIFGISGKSLLESAGVTQTQVVNFIVGDPNSRGGVRITAKDLDGDDRIDLIAGAGDGLAPIVSTYLGKDVKADGSATLSESFAAFDSGIGGVYVA